MQDAESEVLQRHSQDETNPRNNPDYLIERVVAMFNALDQYWEHPDRSCHVDESLSRLCFALATDAVLHGTEYEKLFMHIGIYTREWAKLGTAAFLRVRNHPSMYQAMNQELVECLRDGGLFLTKVIPCKCPDYVEAVGLVNAKILNGKRGWVKRAANSSGRLAVQFEGQDTPKLLKACNLKTPEIPPDEDDPRFEYCHPDCGNHSVLVENAQGKTCATCGCNLEGVYRVEHGGVSYCERDFVKAFCTSSLYNVCILCHKFVPIREGQVFDGAKTYFHDIHPNRKLPNGEFLNYLDDGGCIVHEGCFECTLCGEALCEKDALEPHDFVVKPSKGPRATTLLHSDPPEAFSGCDTNYDNRVKALNRKTELEALDASELCSILRSRKIPFTAEEKASLVRKVIVTDKKKGDITGQVSTKYDEHGNVVSELLVRNRAAPGAELRNRRCRHDFHCGSCDNEKQASMRKLYHEFVEHGPHITHFPPRIHGNAPSFCAACVAIIDYWATRQSILKSDKDERFVSKEFWSTAVNACVAENTPFECNLGLVAASLITDAMSQLLDEKDAPSKEDFVNLLTRHPLADDLEHISQGPRNLYTFMHRPDSRCCECMEYVATAAEIGRIGKVSLKVEENLEHCAFCGATLANPKICNRCEETPYCNRKCQKAHWKTHKKECVGRKK